MLSFIKMVRNIAGVLMAIGSGEQPIAWAQQVLERRDRTQASVTAPAAGLYLCWRCAIQSSLGYRR